MTKNDTLRLIKLTLVMGSAGALAFGHLPVAIALGVGAAGLHRMLF